MAYIFYDNFKKLIQINTTIEITRISKNYSCPSITVACQYYEVGHSSVEFPDGNFMKVLKAMMKQHRELETDGNNLEDMFGKLTIKNDLNGLIDSIKDDDNSCEVM